MPKRWSKLKKLIEDLFVPSLPLRIHCTDIRTNVENEGTFAESLGVFYIRLGKEIIWNFPSQFVDEQTRYPDGGNSYSYSVRDLNELLRDYLDSAKADVLMKDFSLDHYGLTNILKAADRRIGLKRLQKHFKDSQHDCVMKVLSCRRRLKQA